MNNRSTALATLLALFISWQPVLADDTATAEAVKVFQLTRFDAMINADLEALEGMLADELTYAHTNGWTETKAGFLVTVGSGKINYLSLVRYNVDVRIYGDIAVMTGTAAVRGAVDDREIDFTMGFLDVTRRAGDSWQLVAWQSVRIPAD